MSQLVSPAFALALTIAEHLAKGLEIRLPEYRSSESPNEVFDLILERETLEDLRKREAEAADALRACSEIPEGWVEPRAALLEKWSGQKPGVNRGPVYIQALVEGPQSAHIFLREGAKPETAEFVYIRAIRQVQKKALTPTCDGEMSVKQLITHRFLDHGHPHVFQIKIDASTKVELVPLSDTVKRVIPATLAREEYVPFALRTEAPIREVIGFHSAEKFGRMMHALVGVITEVDEILQALESGDDINTVNLLEEGGDFFWYSVLLQIAAPEFADVIEASERCPVQKFDLTSPREVARFAKLLQGSCRKFAGQFKRYAFYTANATPTALQEELTLTREAWTGLCLDIFSLIRSLSGDPGEVRGRNARKLMVRYRRRFSSTSAFCRSLAEELKMLSHANSERLPEPVRS